MVPLGESLLGESEKRADRLSQSVAPELQGLLVLLNEHNGSEDVALLADDLDLEIDEILPSIDYAETLGLLKVAEGRASLTETGRKLLSASIRERKTILRDLLKKTTLFKTLLRALESAPEGRLTEEDVQRLLAFTTAPGDSYVLNIINWGRYAELFRYDADEHALIAIRSRVAGRTPPSSPPSNPARRITERRGQGPSRPRTRAHLRATWLTRRAWSPRKWAGSPATNAIGTSTVARAAGT